MSWFQIIVVPLALTMCLRSLVLLLRSSGRYARMMQAMLAIIWGAAAVFVYRPEWTSTIARHLGIERGADLVLYGLVLVFLGFVAMVYYRICDLRRDITQIVRHIAVTQARHPDAAGDAQSVGSDGAGSPTSEEPA